ncbi:hypothetical protein Tco_0116441 [Tanacetum coccineum]
MLVQGPIFQGAIITVLVESHHTPTSAPSTSQPPTSPPSMKTTHVVEEAATMPHDSPLQRVHSLGSGEGSMTLHELTVLCTTLSKKVESLESDLKLVVSEDEDDLEDPSKQGRKISQLDEDEGITLVQMGAQTQGRHEHDLEPDFEFTAPEEVYTAEPDISTTNVPVSTAAAEVSTVSPKVKIVVESLVYIRRSASKRKDKGKAIMKEAEPVQKKTKMYAIEQEDELGMEEALRLPRTILMNMKAIKDISVHEEANTFNAEEWDNIQAQIEADEELAQSLTSRRRKSDKLSKADEEKQTALLVPKILTGSSKRTAETELQHEGSKRQKTNKEQSAEEEKELS